MSWECCNFKKIRIVVFRENISKVLTNDGGKCHFSAFCHFQLIQWLTFKSILTNSDDENLENWVFYSKVTNKIFVMSLHQSCSYLTSNS